MLLTIIPLSTQIQGGVRLTQRDTYLSIVLKYCYTEEGSNQEPKRLY